MLEDIHQIVTGIEDMIQNYGIVGAIVIGIVILGMIFLGFYLKTNVEAAVTKGVEKALQKHQKSLDLIPDNKAIISALRLDMARKSIELRMEFWRKFMKYYLNLPKQLGGDRQIYLPYDNSTLVETYRKALSKIYNWLKANTLTLGPTLSLKATEVVRSLLTISKEFESFLYHGEDDQRTTEEKEIAYNSELIKASKLIELLEAELIRGLSTDATILDYEAEQFDIIKRISGEEFEFKKDRDIQ